MRRTTALVLVALTFAGLAGCASQQTHPDGEPIVMGNAAPVRSPKDESTEHQVAGIEEASDVATAGEVIAIKTPAGVAVGTAEEIAGGEATQLDIDDPACGNLSATENTFVLACARTSTIFTIDAKERRLVEHPTERPFSTATLTSTGELVAASAHHDKVGVLRDEQYSEFRVTGAGHEIVSTAHSGSADGVALINTQDTTIHDVDWVNNKPGPALRVGLGVGRIAAGESGVVFATDTTGDQILVYTVTDTIRLHQTHPTDDSPYALAWDGKNTVVWVASTGTNTLTAFDISTGVPIKKATLPSAANIQGMGINTDGAIVTASPTSGISIIPADVVRNALSKG